MLAEGLQNAEDSGATHFAIVHDTRNTAACTPAKDKREALLQGHAFLLLDNGRGFGQREWRSLQNLHQSEKKHSPREIGRYGMGSRSYFHYAGARPHSTCCSAVVFTWCHFAQIRLPEGATNM